MDAIESVASWLTSFGNGNNVVEIAEEPFLYEPKIERTSARHDGVAKNVQGLGFSAYRDTIYQVLHSESMVGLCFEIGKLAKMDSKAHHIRLVHCFNTYLKKEKGITGGLWVAVIQYVNLWNDRTWSVAGDNDEKIEITDSEKFLGWFPMEDTSIPYDPSVRDRLRNSSEDEDFDDGLENEDEEDDDI